MNKYIDEDWLIPILNFNLLSQNQIIYEVWRPGIIRWIIKMLVNINYQCLDWLVRIFLTNNQIACW